MSEQVFPLSEAGMSKLKLLEIVDDTPPKHLVPLAFVSYWSQCERSDEGIDIVC